MARRMLLLFRKVFKDARTLVDSALILELAVQDSHTLMRVEKRVESNRLIEAAHLPRKRCL